MTDESKPSPTQGLATVTSTIFGGSEQRRQVLLRFFGTSSAMLHQQTRSLQQATSSPGQPFATQDRGTGSEHHWN